MSYSGEPQPPTVSALQAVSQRESDKPVTDFVKVHLGGGYGSEVDSVVTTRSEQQLRAKPFSALKTTTSRSRLTRPRTLTNQSDGLTAWQRHREFMSRYRSHFSAKPLPVRTDAHVLAEQHRFIRHAEDDADIATNWEVQLAKKYYDKLFKEYALADLSRYREGKVGLRWRTEKEVVAGKGQFTCGNKTCDKREGLVSLEVNFAYREDGERKNALVKLRACSKCADKVNYKKKKEEAKKRRREERRERGASRDSKRSRHGGEKSTSRRERSSSRGAQAERRDDDRKDMREDSGRDDDDARYGVEADRERREETGGAAIWSGTAAVDKTEDEEIDDYFAGLFP